jgi:hypothetical protein
MGYVSLSLVWKEGIIVSLRGVHVSKRFLLLFDFIIILLTVRNVIFVDCPS